MLLLLFLQNELSIFRNASKLRESFVLDYGTLLMGHHSLWQAGLSYLDCCPTHGLFAAELLLQRLPIGSENRTHKIIKEAHKRNLPHLGNSFKIIFTL